jgi:DNA-binding XRE family transcriptional regulator
MAMAKTLKDKMASLVPERREKIEAMTVELIAEEKSLRDLRQALALTQEHMAEILGVGQESVSRLEKRSDLLLSTLRSYVRAMGGELRLVAEFPNRPPVLLKGLASMNANAIPAIHKKDDQITKRR